MDTVTTPGDRDHDGTSPVGHDREDTVVTPASAPRVFAPRPPVFAPETLLAQRFRIVRFIARGGMGEVYEAEDRVLGERVALKTIRSDVANDQRSMERFLREVHLSRSVTHPNVCRIFDVFHHENVTFLTMELLPGETLAERLHRSGRIVPAEALPLVEQMAGALGAAHEAGVIHRDFKSGNVMLVPDERRPGGIRVVVTDFGLARSSRPGRQSAAPLTETEAVLGTPDYMAPEQIEGKDLTPAADVYALGIVMYEMVTGEPPFQGDTPLSVALKKLKEAAPSPRSGAPDLPPVWDRAILRCLERNPGDRYATTADLVRALHGEEIAPGPGERRRRRRILAAVAAGVVVAAALGFLATRLRVRGARSRGGGVRGAPVPARDRGSRLQESRRPARPAMGLDGAGRDAHDRARRRRETARDSERRRRADARGPRSSRNRHARPRLADARPREPRRRPRAPRLVPRDRRRTRAERCASTCACRTPRPAKRSPSSRRRERKRISTPS